MKVQGKTEFDGVFIAGPTASGKSAIAMELADRLDGTIINADSMQVYRDLRVLTARPSEADELRIPHRLYGILDAEDICSAGRWVALAQEAYAETVANKRLPIFVGGTGLYLKSLLEGLSPIPDVSPEVRQRAVKRYEAIGVAALFEEVSQFDPKMAHQIGGHDPQRLMRAWSVYEQTGMSLGEWQTMPRSPGIEGHFLKVVLSIDRAVLYQRCNERFERMVAEGAIEETEMLISRALAPTLPIMKAIGVPELSDVIGGKMSLAEAIAKSQGNTRNYVKRQETWFKNQMISWKRVSAQLMERSIEEIFTIICKSS